MAEVYDREEEPWEEETPKLDKAMSLLDDAIRMAAKEEMDLALWDIDYAQWPWTAYPEEALGD